MSTTSMAILSNPLFATYSVYARNASIDRSRPAFQGHSRSSEPTWIDPQPTTPYQRSIATMGLSAWYHFCDKRGAIFSQKPPIFLTAGLLNAPPPLEFALELVPALGVKIEWWCYRAEKEVLTIFSRLKTRERDRWTNGHLPTAKTAFYKQRSA